MLDNCQPIAEVPTRLGCIPKWKWIDKLVQIIYCPTESFPFLLQLAGGQGQ